LSHKIYLVSLTFERENDTKEYEPFCQELKLVYQPKAKALANSALFLFTPVPLEVAYCRNKKMNSTVKEMMKEKRIDLIYIKRLRAAQFVDPETTIPVVLDTTDAMSRYYREATKSAPWYRKPLFLEEQFKYRLYEKRMSRAFKNWVVCSPVELEYLKRRTSADVKFFLVPNGVDTDFYTPTDFAPERHSILLSGLMDKFVNIEAAQYFIKDILPAILEKIPDVKLYIVGPNPPLSLRKLARHNIIITGGVEDLRGYISRSKVVVVPIKTGTGTRNKILQSWAMARPVVTTSKGLQGLKAIDNEHVFVADDPKLFADKIIMLLKDDTLQKELIQNSLKLVEEKYAMKTIVDELNTILQRVAS